MNDRDRRAAAAFAGQIARYLRAHGFTATAASSREREGLRVHTIARGRCKVSCEGPNAAAAIDLAVTALHEEHWRTWRSDDCSVVVHRTGSAIDSHDTRIPKTT